MSVLLGLLMTACAGSSIAGGVLAREALAEGDTGTRLALRVRRRLRGALGPGRVGKLVGVVESCHGAPLVAPITLRACVAYEARVRVRELALRPLGGPVLGGIAEFSDVRARDFVLRDEVSGVRMYVRASVGVRAFLAKDRVLWTGPFAKDATAAMQAFVDRYATGFRPTDLARRAAAFREGVVCLGDRVAVVGSVVFDDDPNAVPVDEVVGGYRTSIRKLGVGPLPRGGPLLIGNEPGALD